MKSAATGFGYYRRNRQQQQTGSNLQSTGSDVKHYPAAKDLKVIHDPITFSESSTASPLIGDVARRNSFFSRRFWTGSARAEARARVKTFEPRTDDFLSSVVDRDRTAISYRDAEPGPAQGHDRGRSRTALSHDTFSQAGSVHSDVGSSCAASFQVWAEDRCFNQ